MIRYVLPIAFLFFLGCDSSPKNKGSLPTMVDPSEIHQLDIVQANRLAQLPLHCLEVEYPNKLNQVIAGPKDLRSPRELHPAFFGCFDWHSAVHGHWSLVSLLRHFPDLENAELIKRKLLSRITEENIFAEVAYFDDEINKSYERAYGWAWVFKLAEELHVWDEPMARELSVNLRPLTNLLVEKLIEFLPKLNYPIRIGEHTNTAFSLSFAWDYAIAIGHRKLKDAIDKRARLFYSMDRNGPLSWEPSGYDFLSPCLEEAALMKRILDKPEFDAWISAFLPRLGKRDFDLEVGIVSDRSDGKLVHLDGLNFSRAWCLNKIAEGSSKYDHLKPIANKHITYSLPNLVGDKYEGGHWLGSFAIYALNSARGD
jgi:hypothetical protein